jgi:hypothetical protein
MVQLLNICCFHGMRVEDSRPYNYNFLILVLMIIWYVANPPR